MLQFIFLILLSTSNGQVCNCGRRYEQPAARIYRGKGTVSGHFPWQMLLEIWHMTNGILDYRIYGGVLISARHVITCATCLEALFINRLF